MEETAFPKKIKVAFSLLMIIGAISFYLGWGLIYNAWNIFEPTNMGVYAIFVVMMAFGILGLMLTSRQQ
jgi:MFS-type transporter involved in bile tolerance (Atg22 family)